MARQYLIPGWGYINETSTRQYLIPGQGYVNETTAPPASGSLFSRSALDGLSTFGPKQFNRLEAL